MNRTLNIQIEDLDNGYLVNAYTYGGDAGGDPIIGPAGSHQRSYAKDWDDVAEMVAEFLVDQE